MCNALVVVDVVNDFTCGSLGSKLAYNTVPKIIDLINKYVSRNEPVIYLADCHDANYFHTREGRHLSVKHCEFGTSGAELDSRLPIEGDNFYLISKSTFGSEKLMNTLRMLNNENEVKAVEFCGFCTDICVISNIVIAETALPNAEIYVCSDCCVGTTKERHKEALDIMDSLHVNVT